MDGKFWLVIGYMAVLGGFGYFLVNLAISLMKIRMATLTLSF